jgi:hypothetical protein
MSTEPRLTSAFASNQTVVPLGLFCSQTCPGDIILKAQDWANSRDSTSSPVIGGFHTPIGRDVLRILLRGTASVTIVVARAIDGWRASPDIKHAVASGSAQLISPYPARSAAVSGYHEFLAQRRVLLADCLNAFLGLDSGMSGQ